MTSAVPPSLTAPQNIGIRPLKILITAGTVRLNAVRSGMGDAGDKVNYLSLEIYSLVVSGSASFPVDAFIWAGRIPIGAELS
jgi:hypothetical protein